MKRYTGRRIGEAVEVRVDGVPLNPRFDLWNYSPDGFEWGYSGAGPTQLALAILADCLGEKEAVEWHYDFKAYVISGLPPARWRLTEKEIRDTIKSFAKALKE